MRESCHDRVPAIDPEREETMSAALAIPAAILNTIPAHHFGAGAQPAWRAGARGFGVAAVATTSKPGGQPRSHRRRIFAHDHHLPGRARNPGTDDPTGGQAGRRGARHRPHGQSAVETEIALIKLQAQVTERTEILQIAEHYKAKVVDCGPIRSSCGSPAAARSSTASSRWYARSAWSSWSGQARS